MSDEKRERFRMNEMEDPGCDEKKRVRFGVCTLPFFPSSLLHQFFPASFVFSCSQTVTQHCIFSFAISGVCVNKRAIECEPFSCGGVYFRLMKEGGRWRTLKGEVLMVWHGAQGCVSVFTFGLIKDSGTVLHHPPLDNISQQNEITDIHPNSAPRKIVGKELPFFGLGLRSCGFKQHRLRKKETNQLFIEHNQ